MKLNNQTQKKSSRNKEEYIKKRLKLKINVLLMLQRTVTFHQEVEYEPEISSKHTMHTRFIR